MTAPDARCERCDRAECRRGRVPMPRDLRAIYKRVLDDPGTMTAADRAAMHAHSLVCIAADDECKPVDWRARALAAEEYRAKVEPLIEAVRRWRDALGVMGVKRSAELHIAVDRLLDATAPTKEHA